MYWGALIKKIVLVMKVTIDEDDERWLMKMKENLPVSMNLPFAKCR